MIGQALGALQLAAGGSVLALGGWWTLLSGVAIRRPRRSASSAGGLRWVVVVPAHNEEQLISKTVQSLLAAGVADVLVVADNCTDATATRAIEAGARTLVRTDPAQRGKSHALEFALAHLRTRAEPPEAVLFVDADTLVSENICRAAGARLSTDATVVQVHYEGAAVDAPVARIRRLALSLIHWARPLGASRLGLPTTLKGNGMAFRWEVIREGFPGAGITEDAAATLGLARAGHTVEFEPRASVTGQMATTLSAAKTQDMRWEGGRLALLPCALSTTLACLARGKFRPAAAAFELASPPLTLVGVAGVGALGLGVAGFGNLALAVAATVSLGTYVLLGLIAARASRTDLVALVYAPRFVAHKLAVFARLTRGQPRTWERTSR